MRSVLVVIGAALFAGLSVAQNLTEINNLPSCGKICITNMLGQASSLGCPSETNITCLCANANFKYGIRDCVDQSCPSTDVNTVMTFGNGICAEAAGSSVETVTATQTAGTTTLVISTGTNSAGQPFTTTLGVLGAPPTGVGVVITTTNSAGSSITTTVTVAASGQPGNASLITTTNSAGMTTVITASPSGATGPAGVIVLTGTNSAGSVVVTTITSNSTATGTNSTAVVVPATTLVTTNSAGSTITTTQAATTATGGAGGSGTTTAATATSSGAAAHLAGPVFGGVAGLLALAFL